VAEEICEKSEARWRERKVIINRMAGMAAGRGGGR